MKNEWVNDHSYRHEYIRILEYELKISAGCTEPAAIAYAAAILSDVLGETPVYISATLSNNILKNVKSVAIPNTNGMSGVKYSIALGYISGQYKLGLDVLASFNPESYHELSSFVKNTTIAINSTKNDRLFEIDLVGRTIDNHIARVMILDRHSNLSLVSLDNDDLTELYQIDECVINSSTLHYELLNVPDIVLFAQNVPLEKVEALLQRQLDYNIAIAEDGLNNKYGESIGRMLLSASPLSLKEKAKAYAAAGSDARMNGANREVCIISGSGNQGITTVLPVYVYAEALSISREKLLRALLVADLITIYQKQQIGCLSAYCGATSAGCGAGCGICFLLDGSVDEISLTLSNSVAILSGMICDGAKSSCAAKIAMAVESGIIGCEMAMSGRYFKNGQGIVSSSVARTINNIGLLARFGMKTTDETIIAIMLKEDE